jgi:hypothetical protein
MLINGEFKKIPAPPAPPFPPAPSTLPHPPPPPLPNVLSYKLFDPYKTPPILLPEPKKRALEVTKELNRRYGKEIYRVVEGNHKGTYKIKDSNNNTIADYTGKKGHKPKSVNILGNKFIDINSAKNKIKKILKDERNSFRFDKDKDTLRRIKEAEYNNWLR